MTEQEFLMIYEKYRNTVYSIAFNYLRSTEDAEDIQQEVFIKLLNGTEEFENEEHRKAWLIRVSINLCKNHLRSRKRWSDSPLPEDLSYEDPFGGNELIAVVQKLPEKYRVPIHLFYYEDFTVKQIAEVLNMPEATVKVRLKRGRDKLGKTLQREDWL